MARTEKSFLTPIDYRDACPEQQQGGIRADTQVYCGNAAQTTLPDENYIVEQLFTYHPADPFTGPKFETLREAAKYFAKVILNNVPAGADRTAAIRKLREAVMTANAGISLRGLSL